MTFTMRNQTRDEDVAQAPGVGEGGCPHAVLGQRDHGAVVEHRQKHDQDGGEVPGAAAHTPLACNDIALAKPACAIDDRLQASGLGLKDADDGLCGRKHARQPRNYFADSDDRTQWTAVHQCATDQHCHVSQSISRGLKAQQS